MSDLLQRIREAQTVAGEDVVVDDLRRKGLLSEVALVAPATPPKLALVGTLADVEALIREYVETLEPHARLTTQLTFSMFVLWLRKRQETTNATKFPNRDDL